MRPRYLLLVAKGPELAAIGRRIADATGLEIARCAPPVTLLVNHACDCLAIDDESVVVGTLFHRHGRARRIAAFGNAEGDRLVRGGTEALLRDYWGAYLHLRWRGSEVTVLRDPSAALPCYRAQVSGALAFASDLELLSAAGARTADIAWDALGRLLHASGLPAPETAIDGVTQLLPGMAVTLDGAHERSAMAWSPWDFVEPSASGETGEIAERLRRVVEHCVTAWASLYRHPLLSVSGGLDSSIVAACLASTGQPASCVTLYTDDPAGDERGYAGALCAALGLPLAECRYALDAVDLGRALGAHLPRPIGRAEAQPYEAAHLAVAAQQGADAFFTGNGGDNVFGYSQSAAALADRALHEGPGAGAFATLRDICRQTGAGPLRVTRAALRVARQPPGYRWKPNPALLHPDLIPSLGNQALAHPWLDAPPWALPGKAAHIAGLLRAHPNLEPDRSRTAPVINPLLSQPIVEACLTIPSWQWREGGRDRAAARAAFAGRLPPVITERRVKGTPDPFCGEIVNARRDELRARLLDGALAAHGLLDPGAIEEALQPDRPTTGEENVRLLELANAEAWLAATASRPRGGTRATGSGAFVSINGEGEVQCPGKTR